VLLLNPLVINLMENTGRLTLAELKSKAEQKSLVSLENVFGGNADSCHCEVVSTRECQTWLGGIYKICWTTWTEICE
jgi:hypothetical protein